MSGRLGLFAAYGVELEYMLVDRHSLDVLPAVDRLLELAAGEIVAEIELGEIAWSNELALHVLELKTASPAPQLAPLPSRFQDHVARANALAEQLGGRLLPTAMHPWMDPHREMRLWPHEHSPIYAAYDRIFDCRGHGWANLQSCHLNLPFADDAEFGRLHAAVRLLLPLLPALAASSPFADGRATGSLDFRLVTYRNNSARVPSVAGDVIPEPVYDRASYERDILQRVYRDVALYDPEGVLQKEFLNARGAIARFGRGSLEIRLLDVQEHPGADLAIVALVAAALRLLVGERWGPGERQRRWPVAPLAELLRRSTVDAEATVIEDPALLAEWGMEDRVSTAGEVWRHLAETATGEGLLGAAFLPPLEVVFRHGTLARRILRACGAEPSRSRLAEVYGELARCLGAGEAFVA